jgi:uncharacterized UBP type Zn finger protein
MVVPTPFEVAKRPHYEQDKNRPPNNLAISNIEGKQIGQSPQQLMQSYPPFVDNPAIPVYMHPLHHHNGGTRHIRGSQNVHNQNVQNHVPIIHNDNGNQVHPGIYHQDNYNNGNHRKISNNNHISPGPLNTQNFKRQGLSNLGNTCYLNATLQVLRNSLSFKDGDTFPGYFANILIEFYFGSSLQNKPKSIVYYLEEKLNINLRQPQDAATYMDTICKNLREEGSTSLLEKVEIHLQPIKWKCSNCQHIYNDTRSLPPMYCLTLPENNNREINIQSALQYERPKKCNTCSVESLHLGIKEFKEYPKHLVLVPQNPKEMKLSISEEPIKINNFQYSLIGVILHMGEIFYVGHYIALVKDGNKWIECNDTHVQEIQPQRSWGWVTTGGGLFSRFSSYTPTLLVYEQQKPGTEIILCNT